MERIVILLSLLFCFGAQAAIVPAGVPVNNLGITSSSGNPSGSVPYFQDSDGTYPTFTLIAGSVSSNTVTNSYYPFYRDGVAYATPNNKKVYCKNFVGGGSTTFLAFQLVTSTAAITTAQSAALTSPKYQCGADQRSCMATLNTAANTWSPIPGGFVGGDGATVTYVGFQAFSSAQSMQLQMTCYEK